MDYSKFEKLAPEKRQRIINAALYEFTLYGEAKASSNRIVKCAGIGKGMLFYYFGNMEGAFRYLALYTHAKLSGWMTETAERHAGVLARWESLLDFAEENHAEEPALAAFLASMYGRAGKNAARIADYAGEKALLHANLNAFYQQVDTGCFPADVDASLGIKCIRHVMLASVREAFDALSETGVEPAGFLTAMEQLREMLAALCRLHCKTEALAC
ncbi:MAG: TetR/AcrR family transcriptional regulator [Ruminococcaceae bacterium]|nr:TetR/AcrR family transcriptional regulator [Oscillospiraceae bacterium]